MTSDIDEVNTKVEKQIDGIRGEFQDTVEDAKNEITIEVTDQIDELKT